MARKLIRKSAIDAQILRDKVAKHRPGRRFDVYPITCKRDGRCLGYQVVEIRRVGWWGQVPTMASLDTLLGTAPAPVEKPAVLATVTLPLVQETPSYVGVDVAGKTAWFGRGTLVDLVIGGGQATLTLARKAIEKRGLGQLLEAAAGASGTRRPGGGACGGAGA
jgi:hypothetical protein